MRAVIFIIFLIVPSFGDLDFNAKTRNFSVELLYHAQRDTNEDVILSPYVIWSLLVSLAYETVGVTREQVSKVFLLTENRREFVEQFVNLQGSLLVKERVYVTLLNFLFYDEDLHVHSDGIRRLEDDFSFVTHRVDFKNPIEAIVSTFRSLQQCGMTRWSLLTLTDFLDTTMIMCNCLTFRAKWFKPFDVVSEDLIDTRSHLRISSFESLHASVTELPYEGGEYSMLLIRPHSGYDVKQVYGKLREVSLKDVLGKLQSDANKFGLREFVEVLPKHTIESRVVLNKPLFEMGLTDVFDDIFSNFDNFAEDLYIGEITQTVRITFDEYKTVVYTSTPSYELKRRIPSRTVAVNDPFIFLIMEKYTSTILFGGSYTKKDMYD